MKKIILTITMIMGWGVLASHAHIAVPADTIALLTAEECFTSAPKDVIKLITPSTRLDMVDYFNAGIDHPCANIAGGESSITSRTPESITIDAGTGVTYELFTLNTPNTQYIGVIETLDTPIADSLLKIYTSDWKELRGKKQRLFTAPTLAEWLPGADKKQLRQAHEALPFVLAKYSYDPAESTLTITNNMEQYFSKLDTPDILSQMRKELVYKWDSKRNTFILQK